MLTRTINSIRTFLGLTDTPSSYAGQSGKVVKVKSTEDGLEFGTGGGASAFTALTDTFASYTGQAGKVVMINATEDGVEPGTPQTVDEGSFTDVVVAGPDDVDEGAF